MTFWRAGVAAQGKFAEAETLMLESHAALKASAVSPARVVQGSAVRLAAMYWAWGKTDEAKVWEAGK